MKILDRQNEINSLKIQTTARLLYDRANTIDMIEWIIVILLPILKVFLGQNIFLDYFMILWFFFSFILDYFIEKYTDTASELKKSFDYYVFGWTSNFQEKLLYLSKTYEARNKEFYRKQIRNSGVDNPSGVKDWYTIVEKDVSSEEAIKSAMKQNIYFDKRINNSACFFIVILLVIVLLALSTSELTFYEMLFGLFVTFASFTKKLYSTFVNIRKVSKINSNIENLLCNENKDVDLVYLQSEIDKKRSISRTSNKLIYLFQTQKLHNETSVFLSSNSKDDFK